jgi:hypothetical protein
MVRDCDSVKADFLGARYDVRYAMDSFRGSVRMHVEINSYNPIYFRGQLAFHSKSLRGIWKVFERRLHLLFGYHDYGEIRSFHIGLVHIHYAHDL